MKATFFVSTGRCGTSFLSKSLKKEGAFITHELEDPSVNLVMHRYYIPMAKTGDRRHGAEVTNMYKIPQMQAVLKTHGCKEYMDTGHQLNFAMFPPLLENIPDISIVRLRRDRYETALSFMTTPKENDIWEVKSTTGYFRWMMSPFFKVCEVPKGFIHEWDNLTRFQKVLWAVDEVERLWSRLLCRYQFDYLEYHFDQLKAGDFKDLKSFLNADIVTLDSEKSKNSTLFRGRMKLEMSIEQMQMEDAQLVEIYNRYDI